ncbi:hypothetical protein [Armatimonas sp.]
MATSTAASQLPFSCRVTQIPTSGSRSFVPPNHAATSLPGAASTIVEA